jgi:hypothetical protein
LTARHPPSGELFEEGFRHRLEPLPAVVMAIELHIKIEKAGQVPLLGIDGALGLPGHLRAEIPFGQGHQTGLRVTGRRCQNLMWKIIHRDQGVVGHRFSSLYGANL